MKYIYLLLMLLFLPTIQASILSGTVYDLDLQEVNKAIITINTQPEQRIVTDNGQYSINVPIGDYLLNTQTTIDGDNWFANETITITKEGEYILDIILEPSFDFETQLTLEEEDIPELTDSTALERALIMLALLVIIGIFYFAVKRSTKQKVEEILPEPNDTEEEKNQLLKLIKIQGGRTTQKELRKKVPYSEAKVSLIIAELESEDKIKKIKKGRGNIIILK